MFYPKQSPQNCSSTNTQWTHRRTKFIQSPEGDQIVVAFLLLFHWFWVVAEKGGIAKPETTVMGWSWSNFRRFYGVDWKFLGHSHAFFIISSPYSPQCFLCIKLYPRFQNFQPRFRGWCRDLPGSSQQQDRREPMTWGWGCGVSFCLGIKGPNVGMQFKYQFKHTLLFM